MLGAGVGRVVSECGRGVEGLPSSGQVLATQLARVIRAEGTTTEKLTPSEWPVGNSVEDIFFINDCNGRAHSTGGGTNPGQVIPGSIQTQAEQAMNEPASMHGLCFSSRLKLLLWLPSLMHCNIKV